MEDEVMYCSLKRPLALSPQLCRLKLQPSHFSAGYNPWLLCVLITEDRPSDSALSPAPRIILEELLMSAGPEADFSFSQE